MSSKATAVGYRRQSAEKTNRPASYKPELDRDSGFSDASSGYFSVVEQTDCEDVGQTSASHSSLSAPQMAVVAGSYPTLSPMIIMNNVVLNQPNTAAPPVKQWGFQPTLEVLPQPQVVILQPMVSGNSSSASLKKLSSKQQRSKKYLPILKSYPKIAPYPSESTSEKSASTSSERSNFAPTQTVRHSRRMHHDKESRQHTGPISTAAMPVPSGLAASHKNHDDSELRVASPAQTLSSSECLQSATPMPLTNGETRSASPSQWLKPSDELDSFPEQLSDPSEGQNKRKRFCNTYNILHKSGLLDITLRTKELIRLNRSTQTQLDLLREHTGLFVEALRSGDPQVWAKLQLSMQEHGGGESS